MITKCQQGMYSYTLAIHTHSVAPSLVSYHNIMLHTCTRRYWSAIGNCLTYYQVLKFEAVETM